VEPLLLEFDTNGNEKQKQCARYWIDDETDDIVYGGSKGSAKSYTGCSLIFSDAFTYPETHYFIARKSLNDLRKFTLPSVHEVFGHWGLTKDYFSFNAQDNFFTLYNGSKVFFLEAKYLPSDPLYERFGSMQMTRGWIEEAGEFEEAAKNNLSASVGRWKNDVYGIRGKILQTCNPSKNYLYFSYYKRFREGTLPKEQKFVQALPDDNKRLAPGYLDRLRRTLSPAQKERLLFGNWEFDDDPLRLFPIDLIADLWTNTGKPGEKYLVVDAARLGGDSIVCGYFEGLNLVRVDHWQRTRTNESAKRIMEIAAERKVRHSHILIDEDGIGGGIVDQIPNSKGFLNNGAPIQSGSYQARHDTADKLTVTRNYGNLKAQCWFKLQELALAGEVQISETEPLVCDKLREDLEVIKEKESKADGKVYIISKDEIKTALGRSSDFGDVLMMRMFFELVSYGDFAATEQTAKPITAGIRSKSF